MRSLPSLVCVAIVLGLSCIGPGCATELDNPGAFTDPSGGSTGASGAAGTAGTSGAAGVSGAAGASGAAGNSGGGGSAGSAGAACDAPTMVFNVPDTQGGCQGSACHMGLFPPELHTPGVAARLKDVPSGLGCTNQVYIDSANPANSFILNKVQQAMPACAARMPFNLPELSADKLQCLVEWVNSVAATP